MPTSTVSRAKRIASRLAAEAEDGQEQGQANAGDGHCCDADRNRLDQAAAASNWGSAISRLMPPFADSPNVQLPAVPLSVHTRARHAHRCSSNRGYLTGESGFPPLAPSLWGAGANVLRITRSSAEQVTSSTCGAKRNVAAARRLSSARRSRQGWRLRLKMGNSSARPMPPTITPMMPIMIGSIRLVAVFSAVSTSWS